MTFNPEPYLIELKGKKYLQTAHRVLWMRHEKPEWSITTELLQVGESLAVRAVVADETGRVSATGLAGVRSGERQVWAGREIEKAEKAETAAIGRALAHAGFGTQFALDATDDETDNLADSPMTPPAAKPPPAAKQQGPPPPAAPRSPLPVPEDTPRRVTAIEVIEHQGRPLCLLHIQGLDRPVWLWTRQPLRDAGFSVDNIETPGMTYEIHERMFVTLKLNEKGHYEVLDVLPREGAA